MIGVTGIIMAASMLRFLDPCTSLCQADDNREGRSLAFEPGFWPSANGQKKALVLGHLRANARIITEQEMEVVK